ncbi:Uncharacterized protein FWK35_00032311 [Aphis craccivora]|uniref:Uncharacterized protein n=1 Tax=Aphis craccivora TaxID=307492 RepID=A0A6G0XZT0_APHCR|nr:Uncharacterized protein FWK35_00032311 [Aphis craccivora]
MFPDFFDSHHPPLEIQFSVESVIKLFKYIINALRNIQWTELFNNNEINTNTEIFYNILYFLIKKCTPTYVSYKSSFPSWLTHSYCKQSHSANDYLRFTALRTQCKSLRANDYSDCLYNIQKSIKYYNPKLFWKFLNDKKPNNTFPKNNATP